MFQTEESYSTLMSQENRQSSPSHCLSTSMEMDDPKPKRERKIRKGSIDWEVFEHPEAYCKNFDMVVDAPTTDEVKDLPSSPSPLSVKVKLVGGKRRRQKENDETFRHSMKTISQMANSIASTYLETGKMFNCDESDSRVEGGDDEKDDRENENDDGQENSNEIDKKKDESFQEKFADCVVQTVNSIRQKRKKKLDKHEDKQRKKRRRRFLHRLHRSLRDDENDDNLLDDDSSSEENFSHQESSDSPSESEETTDDDVETATITMTFARKVVGKRTAEELRKKRERVEHRKKRKERLKMWSQTDYHKINSIDIDETDERYDDPFIDKKVKYEHEASHFTRELKCLSKNENLIAFRKTFLLYQLLHQLLYLKSNVYNRLKPGSYYCFNIITKHQMLKCELWTRRFPYTHQDWVMLTYDVRNKEFFLMLPSQPTRQPVNEIRKSKVLDDDNVFMIMEKDENVFQSWNHPRPDWELTAVESAYPPYSQFVVHQCSKYMDANAGKVVDVKASTAEMHEAFVVGVESEIDRKDFRNLLKYDSVYYSSQSKEMVDKPKWCPAFRNDWNF